MDCWYTLVPSPVGPLLLVRNPAGLAVVEFADLHDGPARAADRGWCEDPPRLAREVAQLDEYFAGRRQTFELDLAPDGTPFQREVWAALLAIPYGATRSYGELARSIGRPHAARAVGAANGRNPLAIIVPCHRVIGTNGTLTGYGGGMARKRWLLAHEGGDLVHPYEEMIRTGAPPRA